MCNSCSIFLAFQLLHPQKVLTTSSSICSSELEVFSLKCLQGFGGLLFCIFFFLSKIYVFTFCVFWKLQLCSSVHFYMALHHLEPPRLKKIFWTKVTKHNSWSLHCLSFSHQLPSVSASFWQLSSAFTWLILFYFFSFINITCNSRLDLT